MRVLLRVNLALFLASDHMKHFAAKVVMAK